MPVQPEKTGGDPQVRIAAKEHPVISLSAGRITVEATVVRAGEDLCIVLTGGDRPHIGTVTLSVPRPSLADATRTSATTSVLNLTGHKDGEAAQYLSERLAATLGATVVVTGGSTSGCVRATAVDALSHGFRAIVPIETCADKHESCHFANLYDLAVKYADVVPVEDVIDRLSAGA